MQVKVSAVSKWEGAEEEMVWEGGRAQVRTGSAARANPAPP